MIKIFVCAPEASGDQLASAILNKLSVPYQLFGLGGPKLEALGLKSIAPIEKTAINGYLTVLPKIPFLMKLKSQCLQQIELCDFSLLVDYPGLNLGFAQYCHQMKLPVHYLAPPQTWVWKQKRAKKIFHISKQVLFPFEQAEYPNNCHYFGHPLLEKTNATLEQSNEIYLLPGSRKNQWKNNHKLLHKAFLATSSEHNIQQPTWVVSSEVQKNYLRNLYPMAQYVDSDNLKKANFAFAIPGTNNLQLARSEIRFVCLYNVSFLAYHLLKPRIKTKFFSLVNLLLPQQNPIPELIQHKITSNEIIHAYRKALLQPSNYLYQTQQSFSFSEKSAHFLEKCFFS